MKSTVNTENHIELFSSIEMCDHLCFYFLFGKGKMIEHKVVGGVKTFVALDFKIWYLYYFLGLCQGFFFKNDVWRVKLTSILMDFGQTLILHFTKDTIAFWLNLNDLFDDQKAQIWC